MEETCWEFMKVKYSGSQRKGGREREKEDKNTRITGAVGGRDIPSGCRILGGLDCVSPRLSHQVQEICERTWGSQRFSGAG